MKTVMLFGTFDFLHAGHLSTITQAKKLGEKIVVIIARDETVKRLKGKLPIHTEVDRKAIVGSIRYVDEVILGDKKDVYKVLSKVKPDIIALGYDQEIFVEKLKEKLVEINLNTKIVRLRPYKKYKSSLIKTM